MKMCLGSIPHMRRAFTLIELLVVISIIGILTSIGTFAYANAQAKSRDSRRKSDLAAYKAASQLYRQDVGKFPCYAPPGCVTGGYDVVSHPAISAALIPTYMPKLLTDPQGINCGYIYAYYPDYLTVFTNLENTNDPDAKAVKPAPTANVGNVSGTSPDNITFTTALNGNPCQGRTYNYWVNNPN